jgi:hypothetical protein
MRPLSELVDCLLRYYEARNRVEQSARQRAARGESRTRHDRPVVAPAPVESQSVFGWADCVEAGT